MREKVGRYSLQRPLGRGANGRSLLGRGSDSESPISVSHASVTDSAAHPTVMVMGTIEYMSPEQLKGDTLDGRSDQFSRATILRRP